MSAFSDSLARGRSWFDERPVRERVLILVTLVVLLLVLGWELAVAPVLERTERTRAQLNQLEQRADDWQEQIALLTRKASEDPNRLMRERLEQRRERLEGLDRQLAEATDGLVSPQAMVALLRNMLAAQQALELVSLELLDPVPVYSSQEAQAEAAEPLMFAHDVELVVSGGYLELLSYLERLETLDQRLGWGQLDYEVDDFPNASARLRVRTLSLSRAGLGV